MCFTRKLEFPTILAAVLTEFGCTPQQRGENVRIREVPLFARGGRARTLERTRKSTAARKRAQRTSPRVTRGRRCSREFASFYFRLTISMQK